MSYKKRNNKQFYTTVKVSNLNLDAGITTHLSKCCLKML